MKKKKQCNKNAGNKYEWLNENVQKENNIRPQIMRV